MLELIASVQLDVRRAAVAECAFCRDPGRECVMSIFEGDEIDEQKESCKVERRREEEEKV